MIRSSIQKATELQVTVIRPPGGLADLNLAELWRFRDVVGALAMRDVKLRYRQTALGVIWVVMQPILAAAIFAFLFGKIARLSQQGAPAFAFAFAGLLLWTAFSSTLLKSSASLVQNAQLVSKVYFPRVVLPVSTCVGSLVDFLVSLVVMGILLCIYRIPVSPAILLLPVWLAAALALALGLGFVATAMSVSYRDVQYVLPVIVPFLMYASPVAFSVAALPVQYRNILMLNPMTGLLDGFRWSLLHTPPPDPSSLAYSFTVSLAAFLIGYVFFQRQERKFADVI